MIKPFADDDAASSIGDLCIENGTTRVVLSGSVEITCDEAGLAKARELKAFFDQMVEELEAKRPFHPMNSSETASVDQVANPFA